MKKIFTILLMLGFSFSFAQKNNTKKKIQSSPTKKAPATLPIEKEESYLPPQYIDTDPVKEIDEKLIYDLVNRGYGIISTNMPLDENGFNFMYDYFFVEKGEKYILISPNGKEEPLLENLNFINVFKDGSKLYSDKCKDYSEVTHCPNLKIVSKNGETKNVSSEYRFLIGVGYSNKINLNDKSFTIVHHRQTLKVNLIDETGKILLDKDVDDISYLFPPYVSVEENNQIKIYHLLDRQFVDFKGLEYHKSLPYHKLFVLKVPNEKKYKVVEPGSQKQLFEIDQPGIEEIGERKKARDFFVVYLGNNVKRVVDRSGKILYEDKARVKYIGENGNLYVYDIKDYYKTNQYSLTEKKYLFPRFYKEVSRNGIFQYVKYEKYYEVKNIKTGEILYTEEDRVQSYGELGNLIYINRTYETEPNVYHRGVNDIYTKDGELIFKEKESFSRLSDPYSNYLRIGNKGNSTIVDKDGKIIIPSVKVLNYIRFNSDKEIFELVKKLEKAEPYECYNLEGNKVECK